MHRYRAFLPMTVEVEIKSMLSPEEVLSVLLHLGAHNNGDPFYDTPMVVGHDDVVVTGQTRGATLNGKIVLESM